VHRHSFHAMLCRNSFIFRVPHLFCFIPLSICVVCITSIFCPCLCDYIRFSTDPKSILFIFFSRGFTLFVLRPDDGRCKLLRSSIVCTLIYVMYQED
jgi:hypothetical protein